MPSKFRQARLGKPRARRRRTVEDVPSIPRTNGASPDMFDDMAEAERITKDYIRNKYKDTIFNKRTAR